MIITLVKEQKQIGYEILKDFEKKYGSLEEAKSLYKETGNHLFLVDYENWEYFMDNPDEDMESSITMVTNELTLTDLEIEILDFIKKEKPESIRALARMIERDVTTIHSKVKELEQEGLIELKTGDKNRKIPVMNYDKIRIAI